MTWEILAALITLGGAFMGAAKIISNNTKAMTEIRCTVETLNVSFREQRKTIHAMETEIQNLREQVHDLEGRV